MKPSLLIVDDDEEIRSQIRWALSADYEVLQAGDRDTAIGHAREARPMVILLDLGLPPDPASPQEGFAALDDLLALDRHVKVIIISGQGERANALKTIGERGAYGFLTKPVDLDELRLILKHACHAAEIEREYRALKDQWASESFEGLLGGSTPMQAVFSAIRKVATSDAPVLILGESGTGKEMAALAIHRRSPRKTGSFVAINCSAIPESLLESELFGHEKGAFTGAHAQRKGRVEMAHGGTLFLDEIGELPPAIQVKLLRFLQEQVIERVGGRSPIQIDTRVLAATNVDLQAAIKAGRFREDLYYRLAVVVLELPPLRDRGGDIPLLAKAFLKKNASDIPKGPVRFSSDALNSMVAHGWPGNVRELENRVKRAVIMAEGAEITAEDLQLTDGLVPRQIRTLREVREEAERAAVEVALLKNRGNVSATAAELGVSRPTLYELMGKLGIRQG